MKAQLRTYLTMRWMGRGLALLLLPMMLAQQGYTLGGMDTSYCNAPGFLQMQTTESPNILLLQDDSGSMDWEANINNVPNVTKNGVSGKDLPLGRGWYGVFEASKCYAYHPTGYFEVVGDANADFSCQTVQTLGGRPDTFAGTFLNLASATRLEVLKKVFTGGIYQVSTQTGLPMVYGDPEGSFNSTYAIHVPAYYVPNGIAQTVTSVDRYTGPGSGFGNLDTNTGTIDFQFMLAPGAGSCPQQVQTGVPQGSCVAPTYPSGVESACTPAGAPQTTYGTTNCGSCPVGSTSCNSGNVGADATCGNFSGSRYTIAYYDFKNYTSYNNVTGNCPVGWATMYPGANECLSDCNQANFTNMYSDAYCVNTSGSRYTVAYYSTGAETVINNGSGNCPGTWPTMYPGANECISDCRDVSFTQKVGRTCYFAASCTCTYTPTTCPEILPTYQNQSYKLRIKVASEPLNGILQENYTKATWGIMSFYSTSNPGRLALPLGASLTSMVSWFRNLETCCSTPLSKTLWSAISYFRYAANAPYNSSNFAWTGRGTVNDPYYNVNNCSTKQANIFYLTDGEPTSDGSALTNFPGFPLASLNTDGETPDTDVDSNEIPWWPPLKLNGQPVNPAWTTFSNGNYGYLDDIAFWAHTYDMRSDLPGDQKINISTVFTFDDGMYPRYLLWETAKKGNFKDINNNGQVDQRSEWDTDGDDIPDGFYEATDGDSLADALRKAIGAILERTSSDGSVDIVGAANSGSGVVVQPFFNPRKKTNDGGTIHEATWVGFIRGFFVDSGGNFREDSDADKVLESTDKVINFRTDTGLQTLVVDRYDWPDLMTARGTGGTLADTVLSEDIEPLFDVGRVLSDRVAADEGADRRIYTSTPVNNWVEFKAANASQLRPYMGPYVVTAGTTDAINVIDYIRGKEQLNMRPRQVKIGLGTVQTWPLGDVIYAKSSIAGPPGTLPRQGAVELKLGAVQDDIQSEHQDFVTAHSQDDVIMYTGANDGMLHAFMLGKWTINEDKTIAIQVSASDADMVPMPDGTDVPLGHETWAYIPFSALPHLNWLTEPEYCHVYSVDGNPRVLDLQAFTDDGDRYSGGWGRVLMFGMRLGCPQITSGTEVIRPIYVFLDVTDPHNPTYLYSFTDPDLGFTFVDPIITRKLRGDKSFDYNIVLMSGPTDAAGLTRTGTSYLYVLDVPERDSPSTPWSMIAKRAILPAALTGFVPVGMMSADWSEKETNDRFGAALPNALAANLHYAGQDFVDDNIYIFGYKPNGSNLDGYILAVDIKDSHGFSDTFDAATMTLATPINPLNQWDTPNDWRVRVLAAFPGQPVWYMAVPFGELPIMYAGTGRNETSGDRASTTVQSIYLLVDPCYSGEGGASAEVVCPATGSGIHGTALLPFASKPPINLTGYSSSLDNCSQAATCSVGPCLTAEQIVTQFKSKFVSKMNFTHTGERIFGPIIPIPDLEWTVALSTIQPIASATCGAASNSYIYISSLLPSVDRCVGTVMTPVTTSDPTKVLVDSVGRIFNVSQTGGVASGGEIPKIAGSFFGFGPTLVDDP